MLCTATATEQIPPIRLKSFEEGHILNNEPVNVVDMALERLQKAGVELIEWRAGLYSRMQVPIVVMDYSYLVEDKFLEDASRILSGMGLPLMTPTKFLLRVEGDFQAQARMHRITRATSPAFAQHLALYPISFSTLSWSEVEKIPSPRCTSIHVPSPPALYASLIRMRLRYPRACSMMTSLASDLSELICYNMLDLQDGYVDPNNNYEWKKRDVDGRITKAAELVRSWNEQGVWRPGEEWIGEALYAIIQGTGDIDYLPCSS